MTITTTTPARRSRTAVIAAATFAGLGIAGAATAITLAVAGPAEAHHAPVTHTAALTVVHPNAVTPAQPITPATPVQPAYNASVAAVQRELGQLNYYEGPINGIMTQQTRDAITYLQRSADLPQTGQLDSATVAALMNQLATGDSQMGN